MCKKYQIRIKPETIEAVQRARNSNGDIMSGVPTAYGLLEQFSLLEGVSPNDYIEDVVGITNQSTITLKEGTTIPRAVKEVAGKYIYFLNAVSKTA